MDGAQAKKHVDRCSIDWSGTKMKTIFLFHHRFQLISDTASSSLSIRDRVIKRRRNKIHLESTVSSHFRDIPRQQLTLFRTLAFVDYQAKHLNRIAEIVIFPTKPYQTETSG